MAKAADSTHCLHAALQFITDGCSCQAVYCAWAALATAVSAEQQEIAAHGLLDALAFQLWYALQDHTHDFLDADPQLGLDILLALGLVFGGGGTDQSKGEVGELALTPPLVPAGEHSHPAPGSSGSVPPPSWPVPSVMDVPWLSLAQSTLSSVLCAACDRELKRQHCDAVALCTPQGASEAPPPPPQQQHRQQEHAGRKATQGGTAAAQGQQAPCCAPMHSVVEVMGRPSVVCLMVLLKWHTTEGGLHLALRALDLAR